MITLVVAAALACPLCTPDGRMALLSEAGAKSFDAMAAPGRGLLRAMAADPKDMQPVVTFIREPDGAASVEAADGRVLSAKISPAVFTEAKAIAGAVLPEAAAACPGRSYSVQRRDGLGAMSAIESRACGGSVAQGAERLAALALASLPECRAAFGRDAFDRLRRCLRS